MPTYGEYRRSVPRVNVRRGYHGNETSGLTRTAKPKAAEAIQSGQLISLDSNGEWVKGVAAGKEPFIAFHDQSDTDVQSSGLLLGLSCAGDYVIETGWFVAASVYAEGTPLMAATGDDTGSVDVATDGYAGTSDIVGVVSHGGKQNVAGVNSQAAATLVNNVSTLNVLSFTTRWIPHRADQA